VLLAINMAKNRSFNRAMRVGKNYWNVLSATLDL
jgi:hypothetical protein